MSGKKINVSNHCMERYAERIMNKKEKIDIKIYVAQNKDRIIERVNKMYEFGKKIYEGKTSNKQSADVCVFISAPWILLTDKNESNAITLYKSEIVVEDDEKDKEINNIFVKSRLEKLEIIKKEIEIEKIKKEKEDMELNIEISNCEDMIHYHKTMSEKYENMLNAKKEILKNNASLIELNEKYKKTIEELVGKKIFKR